ncbi:MAG: hypothetical protein WCE21_01070 [Candidatus Babeliales bacterium]
MKITMISTSNATQTFDANWAELETATGNMVIQANHIPTIVTLTPHQPIVLALKSGTQETIMTSGGIAHVERTGITFILND